MELGDCDVTSSDVMPRRLGPDFDLYAFPVPGPTAEDPVEWVGMAADEMLEMSDNITTPEQAIAYYDALIAMAHNRLEEITEKLKAAEAAVMDVYATREAKRAAYNDYLVTHAEYKKEYELLIEYILTYEADKQVAESRLSGQG